MADFGPISELGAVPRDFRTTHWSVVLHAAGASETSRDALETLCRQYWTPLYAFVRRRGYPEHQAQDLTQDFFARFLAANSLETVAPERGRFRTFLLAALKNFLANEWRDANRQKRGGGKEFISFDEFSEEEGRHGEPSQAAEPDAVFDRRWAETVVATALTRLEKEMQSDGIHARFNGLKAYLQGDGDGLSYADAAQRVGLSEAATKTAIFRMRRRYGELIRGVIAETVDSAEEVEAEIQHLVAVLAA
jgi:RNA polymerase sigma factor (sigma-70 family)